MPAPFCKAVVSVANVVHEVANRNSNPGLSSSLAERLTRFALTSPSGGASIAPRRFLTSAAWLLNPQ